MKKMLFASIAVMLVTATYAKTTLTLEERMRRASEEEIFAQFHYPFASFTGLFNGSYQGKFTEDDIDEVHKMMKKAIRGEEKTLSKYFLSYIQPYVADIYLRKLSWYIQDPDKDGAISLEEADELIDRLKPKMMTGFWDGESYFSARYKMVGGNLDEDNWTPPRKSEIILFLDGDESKPFASLYCGNPIIVGATVTKTPEKKEKKTTTKTDREEEDEVERKGGAASNAAGGTVNTQNVTVNVRGGGGDQRKGNGVLTAIVGGVAGYLIGRSTGGGYSQPYQRGRGRVIYGRIPAGTGRGTYHRNPPPPQHRGQFNHGLVGGQ